MNSTDQQLYRELRALKENKKRKGKYSQGKMPRVCSDDALRAMCELRPKKLSDFLAVPGIGKTFIDKYGEEFLAVILKYTETPKEKQLV